MQSSLPVAFGRREDAPDISARTPLSEVETPAEHPER